MTVTPEPTEPAAGAAADVLAEAEAVVESALAPDEVSALDHLDNPRRALFVHAHPDDEVTGTGITLAYYASRGAQVSVVSCTRGEEGEVHVDELGHLAAAHDDALGEHRAKEMEQAMAALGVTDHRFLGEPGTYRDSGMAGEPSNDNPAAFWQVPVDVAAARLAAIIRELRPSVLVTYDPNGGYGHPDHIQAHRVSMRAVELAAAEDAAAGAEPWQVGKVYWTAIPESLMRAGLRAMKEAGEDLGDVDPDGELPLGTPDDTITTVIDQPAFLPAKVDGWRAYASQVPADALMLRAASDPGAAAFFGREHYVLVRGEPVPDPDDPNGWETDLFAGVA